MLKQKFFEKQSSLRQILDDKFVSVLDENAFPLAESLDKSASVVYHLHKWQSVFSADLCVVFTKSGSNMYDTSTVRQSDVRVIGDIICFVLSIVGVIKRDILFSFIFLTEFYADSLVFFKQSGHERLGKHIYLAVDFYLGVVLFTVHTQSHVGRQSPRRGRPSKKVSVVVLSLELDKN